MAGEELNGALRRELDSISRDIEKLEARLVRLDERLQQTRDAQGEQRGKLAILMLIASAVVSAAIQMFSKG